MTRWWLGAILLMFLSISVTALAGEIACDTFPANSLSRRECEYNAARIKARPAPDAGVVNLGVVPASPYAGTDSIRPDDFCGNPYQYEGKNVVLRGLQFKKALGRGSATFGTQGGREILISGLPVDRTWSPDQWYNLVVTGLGVSEGKNAYGGPVTTPHALYVGLP